MNKIENSIPQWISLLPSPPHPTQHLTTQKVSFPLIEFSSPGADCFPSFTISSPLLSLTLHYFSNQPPSDPVKKFVPPAPGKFCQNRPASISGSPGKIKSGDLSADCWFSSFFSFLPPLLFSGKIDAKSIKLMNGAFPSLFPCVSEREGKTVSNQWHCVAKMLNFFSS